MDIQRPADVPSKTSQTRTIEASERQASDLKVSTRCLQPSVNCPHYVIYSPSRDMGATLDSQTAVGAESEDLE
jgi:hypothetical protein